ncbi:Helicase conserved C-terminal domain-containing protein [Actinomyces ruminicola]|uniref:Helicase conserved C-terminal domain-containing protein n=1 Tax=Actinomyces ruminicola TaxID=332524 RepID=A0A1G9ZHX4_9ACTO|nr:DEAD/DEAH box helicase [Actinomyces ruminicola]SDN20970.1 Helicase conserved C-terminal domain-containing protein [Actinomyces ruminicola]
MPATSAPALNVMLDSLIPADDPERVPEPEEVYLAFAEWAESTGRPLYPHQDEALSEILSGRHVIAATPTGSGKSMIALAAHTASLARGGRSYYTAPLKALVSEKFFELVGLFGADNVGMVTGDTAINAAAPIICCTAEILANQSLREGEALDVDTVVMDEFHYYADPQRGWAWQVPLLELPQAQMVLLSATLGDVSFFVRDLRERTGREVAVVDDAVRPVPLEWEYAIEPIGDLLQRLVEQDKAPAYVVHFSQKEAVERATALLSVDLGAKRRKEELAAAIGDFRFGPGFGRTLSRLLRAGIGVHHAGMLPRYRRLVERLARTGLLSVICGTDTLGVGINVPIRSVVLTSLVKFDGAKERHLTAREFHQVAGRAGRAGFDTRGYVIVQAPEHVIENARALAKAGDDPRKRRRIVRKQAPEGRVNWTDKTFERLRDAAPETLTSQFQVTTTMVLNLMERAGDPVQAMAQLLERVHEPETARRRHVRRAVEIYLSLRTAGVLEHVSSAQAAADGRPRLRLAVDLPDEFALNQPLAPFALAAMDLLNLEDPEHTLDVVSVVESTLDDPRPLLYAQQRQARGEAVAAMKAEGMDYEERMAALEDITWPQPLAELLSPALEMYKQSNPWVAEYELSPKSVVRDMVESAMTFSDLISRYDLGRSEGVVLRYLTDAYRALRQVVPEEHRTPEVEELTDWLGSLVRAVDSSLLDEWEALGAAQAGHAQEGAALLEREVSDGAAGAERAFGADADGRLPFTRNRHAFRVAVRREMFRRVELMARDDVEGLGRLDAASGWGEDRWDEALGRYWDEYDWISTDTPARAVALAPLDEDPDDVALASAGVSERLREALAASGRRVWLATQILEDSAGDHDWRLTALVDLAECDKADAAVVHLLKVGPQA